MRNYPSTDHCSGSRTITSNIKPFWCVDTGIALILGSICEIGRTEVVMGVRP